MRRWQRAGAILALALSAAGCGTWPRNLSGATWPVPPAVDPLRLDREERPAIVCLWTALGGGEAAPHGQPIGAAADEAPEVLRCLLWEGLVVVTLPEERVIVPVALISPGAWRGIEGYVEALRRAYCEGRMTLQRANEQAVDALPICAPGEAR